jgi:pimeloyl-ACP methyl ester carboxylesterase
MNYPGYGGSTGSADLRAIPPAALAVYDHVAKIANGKPIYLVGNSLGTTSALYVATQRPTAGLVLQNPPAIRSLIMSRFGWWNLWLLAGPVALQVPRDLDSIQNARAIRAPAIFLLAEKDEIVPPRYHELVLNAYAGEKRVIRLPGAYHNDPIEGVALADLNDALGWLLRKADSSRAQ